VYLPSLDGSSLENGRTKKEVPASVPGFGWKYRTKLLISFFWSSVLQVWTWIPQQIGITSTLEYHVAEN